MPYTSVNTVVGAPVRGLALKPPSEALMAHLAPGCAAAPAAIESGKCNYTSAAVMVKRTSGSRKYRVHCRQLNKWQVQLVTHHTSICIEPQCSPS